MPKHELSIWDRTKIAGGFILGGKAAREKKAVTAWGDEGWDPLNVDSYLPFGRNLSQKELSIAVIGYSFACINALGEAIAGLDFHLEAKKGDEKITLREIDEHEFLRATKSPPLPYTKSTLWYKIAGVLEIAGIIFLRKNRGKGHLPESFDILPWAGTNLVKERDGQVLVETSIAGKREKLPLSEVVIIHNPNLIGNKMSYGTVESIYPHLMMQASIYASEMEKINKRDFPSLAFERTDDLADEEQIDDFQKYLEEKIVKIMRGKAAPVLPPGLALKMINFERDLSRPLMLADVKKTIGEAFRVPAAILGGKEGAGYVSVYGEYTSFLQFTIKPKTTKISEAFKSQSLDTDYPGIRMQGYGLKMEFDFPSTEDKTAIVTEITATKEYQTVNEVRAKLNLPADPGGDVYLRASGEVPFGGGEPKKPDMTEGPNKAALIKVVRNMTAENLIFIEKKWLASVEDRETKIRLLLQKYFRSQSREVKKQLSGMQNVGLASNLFNRSEWQEKFVNAIHPQVKHTFLESYQSENRREKKSDMAESNEVREFWDGAVVTHHGQLVNDNTMQMIRNEVKKGMDERESVSEIAKRIAGVFRLSEGWRSATIARTMAIGASNAGLEQAWSEWDEPVDKSWFSTLDHRVRHDHEQAHLQTRKVGEMFLVGGERMKYPGDPRASAKNIINCRCTMIGEMEGG